MDRVRAQVDESVSFSNKADVFHFDKHSSEAVSNLKEAQYDVTSQDDQSVYSEKNLLDQRSYRSVLSSHT